MLCHCLLQPDDRSVACPCWLDMCNDISVPTNRMLTITTTDALETVRARVAIVLQAILVATNVCVYTAAHVDYYLCATSR